MKQIHVWMILLAIVFHASVKATGSIYQTFYAALLYREPSANATLTASTNEIGTTNITITGACPLQAFLVKKPLNLCNDAFPLGTGVFKKGLKVETTSTDNVVLQVFLQTKGKVDGYMVYPSEALGNEYYVTSFCEFASLVCQFAVLATHSNTYLKINFSPTYNKIKDQANPNDSIITIRLNELDVLHVESKRRLTGVHIIASNPVAVFAGSRSNISNDPNHVIEQLLPVKLWGTEFVLKAGQGDKDDLIQIIAGERNTKVEMTGYPPFIMPERGQYVQKRIEKGVLYHLLSDYPIQIAQFFSITLYNYSLSSPTAMLVVHPVNPSAQTLTFSCLAGDAYVTMFVKKPNVFQSSAFIGKYTIEQVKGSLYTVTRLTTQSNPFVYGTSDTEFSGYIECNDSSVMPITIATTPFSFGCYETVMHVGDMRDNDCDGEVDEDSCTNDDLTTRFTLLKPTGELAVEFRYFPFKENDYLHFRVRSCGIVMFTLKDVYKSTNFILMVLQNSNFSVTVCDNSCTNTSLQVTPVTNCTEMYRKFSIFVDKTDIIISFNDTRIHLVPLNGKIFRKIGFGTLLQQADLEIEASTKDCSGMMPDLNYSQTYLVIFPPATGCVTDITAASETEVTIRKVLPGNVLNVEIRPLRNSTSIMSSVLNWTSAFFSANTELFVSTICNTSFGSLSFVSLPTSLMGTHFILSSTTNRNYTCAFATASVHANVSIAFAENVSVSIIIDSVLSKVYYGHQFYLRSYSVSWIQSNSNLTGSVVRSDNPIAVSCGSVNVKNYTLAQIPPVEAFGTNFYIPNVYVGNGTIDDAKVFTLNVLSAYDGTTVFKYNEFDASYELEGVGDAAAIQILSNKIYSITSTKPVLIMLSLIDSTGSSAIIVPSTDQYSSINFIPHVEDGYIKSGSSWVENNGNIYSDPRDTNSSEYLPSNRWKDNATVMFGFTLFSSASSGIVLIPGTLVKKTTTTCRLSAVYAGDSIDNDCDGLKDEDYCFVDIVPGSIDFDMDGNFNEDCSQFKGNRSDDETYSVLPCGTTRNITYVGPFCQSSTLSTVKDTSNSPMLSSGAQNSDIPPMTSTQTNIIFPISSTRSIEISSTASNLGGETCDCSVPCAWAWNTTMSVEEVRQEVALLKKKLAVKKDELASTIRSKTSMKDFRPSATSLGVLGIILLTVVIGTIVILDISSLVRDFRMLCENLYDMWMY